MHKLIGVILNAAGVALLMFGGVPYKTNETAVKLGPLEVKAEMDRKFEVPQPVSAGLVAVGTALLLVPGGRKKS